MTSADFSRQALLRRPLGTTSVRPPRVRTRSFPSSIRRIYTSGPCSYWASSCLADLPTLVCLMRFLFVGPTVCLGLLSDPASRRTPLPPAMRLALPPALGTFTLKNVPMPSTPKKAASTAGRGGFSFARTRRRKGAIRDEPMQTAPTKRSCGAVRMRAPSGRARRSSGAAQRSRTRSASTRLSGVMRTA